MPVSSPPKWMDRSSGILLHLTSLPGADYCGAIGPGARQFADFLVQSGQRWWQMLPVHPVNEFGSPYSSVSAFAGESLLLDPRDLCRDEWIRDDELAEARQTIDADERFGSAHCPPDCVDYGRARRHRDILLAKAFPRFRQRVQQVPSLGHEYRVFCEENAAWLPDYLLFQALAEKFGSAQWSLWEDHALRDRHPQAMAAAREQLRERIAFFEFLQFLFQRQWQRLRRYCHERGIGLIGDVPIYVSLDSADTWAHRDIFLLDDDGRPPVVAGTPPDEFNPNGQRWDLPLYRWDVLRDQGYQWWIDRLGNTLSRFDAVRIDHFIGFHNYYQIPTERGQEYGQQWCEGPGNDFLGTVLDRLDRPPLIAEDLGAVSEGVVALRERFEIPGMNVLQFAFCNRTEGDLASEWSENSMVCTGTHDTETIIGWYDAAEEAHRLGQPGSLHFPMIAGYFPREGEEPLHWRMARYALDSRPWLAILPMQDVLGLGADARMNRPGESEGNWRWRLDPRSLTSELSDAIRHYTEKSDRLATAHAEAP